MEKISWEAKPYELASGKWAPKAWIYVDHGGSVREIPVISGQNILFDTEDEAKNHSEKLARKHIKENFT